MGRQVHEGKSIDVTVPDDTLVEKGELYRIEGFTGFAYDTIAEDALDRGVALDQEFNVWSCKVPSGVAGTRGGFVAWDDATGFQSGALDLVNAASGDAVVAQVVQVRNSRGYAQLKLHGLGAGAAYGT